MVAVSREESGINITNVIGEKKEKSVKGTQVGCVLGGGTKKKITGGGARSSLGHYFPKGFSVV